MLVTVHPPLVHVLLVKVNLYILVLFVPMNPLCLVIFVLVNAFVPIMHVNINLEIIHQNIKEIICHYFCFSQQFFLEFLLLGIFVNNNFNFLSSNTFYNNTKFLYEAHSNFVYKNHQNFLQSNYSNVFNAFSI